MRILHAGSELTPFARTGGLGDVIEALPAALAAAGHEASVVLPCYRGLRDDARLGAHDTGVRLHVPIGGGTIEAEIWEGRAPNGVQVFLVRHDAFFDRDGIYGFGGHDYPDNAARFIFFSKCVVQVALRIRPQLDLIHVHDWQTALVPVLAKAWKVPMATVLTIHHLAYQGSFPGWDFGLTNLPGDYFGASGVEFFGNLNLLKGGIVCAGAVTTVSETYAREIQTREGGAGLDVVMREQAHKLHGILNGADYAEWNPAADKLIAKAYKPSNLAGKKACRIALLDEVGLAPAPKGPVFAMVTRLAQQKGIELIFPVIDRMLSNDARLIVLGEGESGYERELMIASRQHPGRFHFRRGVDERLSHLIQAGADVFLMPSQSEPCGLTAMYAQRYGTLPIARATGGLYQIVQDLDPVHESGTGFVFHDYSTETLWDAIVRAKRVFADPPAWKAIVQRAMKTDFSWASAVGRYLEVYTRATGGAA
ncbi:MAG: glycogen synthase GlgA [Chthoniobacteraceae bacterium]